MTKFVGIKEKTYSYLIIDRSKDKKVKGTKNCVMKTKFKGTTKLYFRVYSCVVIIFYNTGLSMSSFSTYYFWK